MNDIRRKEIGSVVAKLETLQATEDNLEALREGLADAAGSIESIRDEEQEYYDNMAEPFQNSSRGEKAQAAIDALQEAQDTLEAVDEDSTADDLSDAIHEAIDSLETARE
jgi:succinate dehydrogenase/fumarate reductase flavoprotein subunit